MNTRHQIDQLAESYREQGYQVVVAPGPGELPPFARDFRVEILARRPDGDVIVSVKADMSEIERDRNLSRYAEVIERQKGWRYDVVALGPRRSTPPDAEDVSESQIEARLIDSERLFDGGFAPQAVLTAWAALESAMRRRLRAMGRGMTFGTAFKSMLNELLSSGELSHVEFRELEELAKLRNIIVHGFSIPEIEEPAVKILADTTRRLLADSRLIENAS